MKFRFKKRHKAQIWLDPMQIKECQKLFNLVNAIPRSAVFAQLYENGRVEVRWLDPDKAARVYEAIVGTRPQEEPEIS